jgi:hypothetical protein
VEIFLHTFEVLTVFRYFDVRDFVIRVFVNSDIFYPGFCRIIDYFWLFLIIFPYFLPKNWKVRKDFIKCLKFHRFCRIWQVFTKICYWLFFGPVKEFPSLEENRSESTAKMFQKSRFIISHLKHFINFFGNRHQFFQTLEKYWDFP